MSILTDLFYRRKNKSTGKKTDKELFDRAGVPKKYFQSLEKNTESLEELFNKSSDFEKIEVKIGNKSASVFYLGTMLNKNDLNLQVLNSLRQAFKEKDFKEIEEIREAYFPVISYKYTTTLHDIVWLILNGYAVLLVDGHDKAIALEVGGAEKRSIEEPSTQTIIRGPKDGFVESIDTNIGLVRSRIKNPKLVFEDYYIGRDSNTKLSIGYLKNVVNEDILDELKKRIKKIDTSAVLDTGNVEEFITDQNFTPFPLIYNTERPDSVSANILEGKIGIFLDGTPFVLIAPTVFTDFFQSAEDYYQPYFMTSFVRIIRYISFMITLILPSLYVALTTYHHELLPTQLLISVQAQREGVPFPAVIEILVMELTFEVLREAGVRMPRVVGQTLSIVGALVIGQAAVEAGLVSNVLVIIVAFSAIASFVSPIYNFAIAARLIRFLLVIIAAVFGLYGVLWVLIMMVIHLVSLRSFGVPYLTPVAPFKLGDQTDVFVRFPIWADNKRPSYLMTKSPVKNEESKPPSPPKKDTGEES
ncbi:spore germination protein [Metabacillus litoralis]|uniref:spore germination protein n=1 Tax=Metabacillus litoralis TaxID=152268 RepID=UPI001CFD7B47|nr:spore germination protein [Metabacillus litoralis]